MATPDIPKSPDTSWGFKYTALVIISIAQIGLSAYAIRLGTDNLQYGWVHWVRFFAAGLVIYAVFESRRPPALIGGLLNSVVLAFYVIKVMPLAKHIPDNAISLTDRFLIASLGLLPTATILLLSRYRFATAPETAAPVPVVPPPIALPSTTSRLEELQQLRERGLLTDEEYEAKRAELVRSL